MSSLPLAPEAGAKSSETNLSVGDVVLRILCGGAALIVLSMLVLLIGVVLKLSWLAFETIGFNFLVDSDWNPVMSEFGSLAFVYGTLLTSAISMVIAIPLGVGTAAFLSEIATEWMRKVGSFLVEMLAAIPSVIYGFWGVLVLAPLMNQVYEWMGVQSYGGVGVLSASLVLAIMIVPYIAAVAFDVCRAVPRAQREASYALGATRWQTIWSVVLPYARPGIVAGCFLALGRALGETMAVTMMIGNSNKIEFSLGALGNTISSVIANEFNEAPTELCRSSLAGLAMILLIVSIGVNFFARMLLNHMSQMGGKPFIPDWLAFWRKKSALASDAAAQPAPTQEGAPGIVPTGTPPAPITADDSPRTILPTDTGTGNFINHVMTGVLGSCMVITGGCLLLILGYIVMRGVTALDWEFFTELPRPIGELGGGMANALVGSLIVVGLATLIAVPVGLLAAIYLTEYRQSKIGPVVRFVAELLTGVPSIVVGIFAYTLVVRPMGHFSGWAGAIALAFIMIPIVMRASEEALRLVPDALRQASYALGASRWQTVWHVVLPAARPAIITAVCLAISRVAGETAPLMLTAVGNNFWAGPNDWTPTLPVNIFNFAMSADDNQIRQAWAAALVLLVVVMLLNFGIRFLTGKRLVQAAHAE
jgi:phosphate transport system permease protein